MSPLTFWSVFLVLVSKPSNFDSGDYHHHTSDSHNSQYNRQRNIIQNIRSLCRHLIIRSFDRLGVGRRDSCFLVNWKKDRLFTSEARRDDVASGIRKVTAEAGGDQPRSAESLS